MERYWGVGMATAAAAALAWLNTLMLVEPHGAAATRRGLTTERLEGVRTTVVTGEGHIMHIAADMVESPPVRLLGPVRLGFLRKAVASDVRIEVDARAPARNHASGPGAFLSKRSLGLSRGVLGGLAIERLRFRVVDPIGRVLTVRARRCELQSTTSFLCVNGSIDHGAREFAFSRAVFDGSTWQILDATRVFRDSPRQTKAPPFFLIGEKGGPPVSVPNSPRFVTRCPR